MFFNKNYSRYFPAFAVHIKDSYMPCEALAHNHKYRTYEKLYVGQNCVLQSTSRPKFFGVLVRVPRGSGPRKVPELCILREVCRSVYQCKCIYQREKLYLVCLFILDYGLIPVESGGIHQYFPVPPPTPAGLAGVLQES